MIAVTKANEESTAKRAENFITVDSGSGKRALLHHFGTAKAVSRAALADLRSVEGVSESLAKQIYDHFHDNG